MKRFKNSCKILLTGAFFSVGFMFLFSKNANAYLDPSVMTYAIQAAAGIIIAIGAVAGIYWRKAKKKVNDKLGIDENRNKEVESDEIIVNAQSTDNSDK